MNQTTEDEAILDCFNYLLCIDLLPQSTYMHWELFSNCTVWLLH